MNRLYVQKTRDKTQWLTCSCCVGAAVTSFWNRTQLDELAHKLATGDFGRVRPPWAETAPVWKNGLYIARDEYSRWCDFVNFVEINKSKASLNIQYI